MANLVKDSWPPIEVIVTSGHRDVRQADLPQDGLLVGKPHNSDTIANLIRRLTEEDYITIANLQLQGLLIALASMNQMPKAKGIVTNQEITHALNAAEQTVLATTGQRSSTARSGTPSRSRSGYCALRTMASRRPRSCRSPSWRRWWDRPRAAITTRS